MEFSVWLECVCVSHGLRLLLFLVQSGVLDVCVYLAVFILFFIQS